MTTETATDVQKIDVPYPSAADLALRLHLGPCRIRFTASDGPSWITGSYTDPSRTFPLELVADGGRATIAQRFEFRMFETAALPILELVIARTRPFALEIEAGASENAYDLSGLPLTRLSIKGGAGRFEVDFATPNPSEMSRLEISMGAGAFTARHLANANFAELRLGGGVSASTLDFSGELRRDAYVKIDAGLASVDVLVPATTSARVTSKSFAAGTRAVGAFSAKAGTYQTPPALEGKHPLLEIEASVAFGSLGLSAS
jgi:hypothetical protein